MRKFLVVMFLLVFVIMSGCSNDTIIKHPYVQEYVTGQGNIKGSVDINSYIAIDAAFEIGANADGYAVFKDPQKAFDIFVKKYADGINLIKKEFNLEPLTEKNYKEYKTYGWQITNGTEDEQEQASFVSRFLDIYENSY